MERRYVKLWEEWEAPEDWDSPKEDDIKSSGLEIKQTLANTFSYLWVWTDDGFKLRLTNLANTVKFEIVYGNIPVTKAEHNSPFNSDLTKPSLVKAKELGAQFIMTHSGLRCWTIDGKPLDGWERHDQYNLTESWEEPEEWETPDLADLGASGLELPIWDLFELLHKQDPEEWEEVWHLNHKGKLPVQAQVSDKVAKASDHWSLNGEDWELKPGTSELYVHNDAQGLPTFQVSALYTKIIRRDGKEITSGRNRICWNKRYTSEPTGKETFALLGEWQDWMNNKITKPKGWKVF